MAKQPPVCKVCDQGVLKKKKKYRMSVPVVLIGYVFLIPSIIGMLIGMIGIIVTGSATSETSKSIKQEVRRQLTEAKVPSSIVEKVINHETVTPMEKQNLSEKQRRALDSARLTYSAGTVGAGAGAAIAGGFSIVVLISSLVGGLLGWLLTMKKKVLPCTHYGAVVSAS